MKKKLVLKNCVGYWRKQKGLTQAGLAEKIGTRRETIQYIEKGDMHTTSIYFALLISIVLEKEICELWWFDMEDC